MNTKYESRIHVFANTDIFDRFASLLRRKFGEIMGNNLNRKKGEV